MKRVFEMKINVFLIILEYFLYTLPFALGVFLSFRWFVSRKSFERFVYVGAFLLPCVSIISLIKVFYILEHSSTPEAFLIPNAVIAIGLIFVSYFITSSIVGKSFARPNTTEILVFILLVCSALLLRNLIKAIDYIAWGAIGIITIYLSRGLAYSRYANKKHKIIFVGVVILVFISITLKLFYYLGFIPLVPTIYISLLLMLLGFLHTILLISSISYALPQINMLDQVYKSKVIVFRRVVILTILATILVNLSSIYLFQNYRTTKDKITTDFEDTISEALVTIHDNFELEIKTRLERRLQYLASTIDTTNLDTTKRQIQAFYESYKDTFDTITIMDKKGSIIYTYPYTYYTGYDLSMQEHVKQVLATKQPTLSKPFMSFQGFPAVSFLVPIFKNDTLTYVMAGLIDLRKLGSTLGKGLNIEINYIILEDDIVFTNSFSNDILLKDKTILSNYTTKDKLVKQLSFTDKLHNFTIYTFGDLNIVNGEINKAFKNTLIMESTLIGIFMLMFAFSLYVISKEERELTAEVKDSILKELETLQQYKETREKLQKIENFVYETDITKPVEEFTKNLFSVIREAIPQIEKGVLWLTEDNKARPIESFGYNIELLKRLELQREIEEKFADEPRIVNNIGVKNFPENLQETAIKLGTDKIKETIVVPIKVDNVYRGHFSLDILSEDKHFKNEDIEVVKTVSKICSFYLSIQDTLNMLKKEIDLNADLASSLEDMIKLISKTTFAEDNETFFGKILDFVFKNITGAKKGSALLREGDYLRYVAQVGFDLDLLNQLLNISAEEDKELSESKEVKIIERIGYTGLSEKERETAKPLGLESITYTIAAGLFIDDEFYGGIFVDTDEMANPFTKSDAEIMQAVSNFGSLFLRSKKLLTDIQSELKVDSIIAQISKFPYKTRIESLLRDTFTILNHSFEHVKYLKGTIAIEERFVNFIVKENSIKVTYTYGRNVPDEIKSLMIGNVNTVIYNNESDEIEIGLSPSSIDIAPLKQLETSLLPIFKSFFIFKDRVKLFSDVLIAFVKAIDLKDPYTKTHSEQVTKYAFFFGKKLNLDNSALKMLTFAATLHDIGKISIKDAILLKNGSLTLDEREEVKKHVVRSYEIANEIESLKGAAEVIRHHHERYDGTGYPDGLKGEEIPYLSRILTIADAFDAMTTDRPYRSALSINEAMEEILKNSGTQFDPELAKQFVKLKVKINEALKTSLESIFAEVLETEEL
jgi:HD-GYP domain-containing protein (c-di-GMP phosphodiesterase class II)